jgi:hypothetical protein
MRCFEGNVKEMLKLSRDSLGNVYKSLWRPFKKYLKGNGDSLRNAQRVIGDLFSNLYPVADTLWERPK